MSKKAKKICFVVTPIGGKDAPIRRHIEGIIDHAIIPALEGKYEVEVAHRKYDIGSINDRVINSIYDADLVVANLTTLNPNVMFELAIRYSFGKPAIVIAEQGTQLPFDIIDENTIFYDNDPTGAYDLKEQLIKFENNIDYNGKQYGPVYKALGRAALYNEIESGKDVSSEKMLRYIVDKLNDFENRKSSVYRRDRIQCYGGIELTCTFSDINIATEIMKAIETYWLNNENCTVTKLCDDTYLIGFTNPMDENEISVIYHEFKKQFGKLYPGCKFSIEHLLSIK